MAAAGRPEVRMRDVSYFVASSLDGFIAGPKGEIDWLASDGDYGYSEFYRSIDTVVMGRKTFELGLSFPAYPYPGKTAHVFTRHGLKSRRKDVVVAQQAPDAYLAELKQKDGGAIWFVGGGELGGELMEAGLIDELVLTVHPITLGKGIPLFNAHTRRTAWRVAALHSWPNGLVQTKLRRRE
jgi:dihydrofolate reductase